MSGVVGYEDDDDGEENKEIEFRPIKISDQEDKFIKLLLEVEEQIYKGFGVPADMIGNFLPSIRRSNYERG